MARSRSAAKTTPRPPRSLAWLQGLLCGALIMVSPALALLFGGLLAPGLVTVAIDHIQGKPVARAVLMSGLAASVAPARELWLAGLSLDAAFAQLSDPLVLGTAWAAGAAGWLLAEVAPIVVRLVLDMRSTARIAELRARRARYEEEWGLPPIE